MQHKTTYRRDKHRTEESRDRNGIGHWAGWISNTKAQSDFIFKWHMYYTMISMFSLQSNYCTLLLECMKIGVCK